MTPLDLAPIHLPPPPSWWPAAPGWWLLALLVCLVLVGATLTLRRWRKRRRLRRWLTSQIDVIAADPQWAIRLHRLLRRALCQLDPQLQQADEALWQASIVALAGKQKVSHLVKMEQQRYLNTAIHHAQPTLSEAAELLHLVLLRPRRARQRLASRRQQHG